MSDNLPSNERPKTPESAGSSGGMMHTRGTMWGGAALILLGVVFLLQTMHIISWSFNWWAFFILIPGLGLLMQAYQRSQEGGLGEHTRGPLMGGTILTLIAVIFLFNLSWNLMWPVFLILIGVGLFVTSATRR